MPVQRMGRSASILMALAVLLALGACDDKQKQAGGHAQGGPVPVSVVTVERQAVPLSTELPGRTSAYRVAEVRPQVSGIVLKRLFEEGTDVKAGQQLYQIDPSTYQAAVQSANADLAKARATLKSTEAKAVRYADLVQINAVSRQDYDDVVASLDQAKAQIMVSQAAIWSARFLENLLPPSRLDTTFTLSPTLTDTLPSASLNSLIGTKPSDLRPTSTSTVSGSTRTTVPSSILSRSGRSCSFKLALNSSANSLLWCSTSISSISTLSRLTSVM